MLKKIKNFVVAGAINAADMIETHTQKMSMRKSKKGLVGKIIGLLIIAVVLGALGSTIFQNLAAFASDGNLSTAERAVAAVFGIFFMLGILVLLLRYLGIKMDMS